MHFHNEVMTCGLAPTILAGKIDPLLFEALYVSWKLCQFGRILLSFCLLQITWRNCLLQASQHAIFFFARVPQIYENFKVSCCLLRFYFLFLHFSTIIFICCQVLATGSTVTVIFIICLLNKSHAVNVNSNNDMYPCIVKLNPCP